MHKIKFATREVNGGNFALTATVSESSTIFIDGEYAHNPEYIDDAKKYACMYLNELFFGDEIKKLRKAFREIQRLIPPYYANEETIKNFYSVIESLQNKFTEK